jgi:hypothetical protein
MRFPRTRRSRIAFLTCVSLRRKTPPILPGYSLRRALWPDASEQEHLREMADVVARGECVLPALLRLSGSSLKDGFAAKVKTAQLRL